MTPTDESMDAFQQNLSGNSVTPDAASSKLATQIASVAASLPGVIFTFKQTADGKRSFPYASENCFNVFGIPSHVLRISEVAVFERIRPDDLQHIQTSIEKSARSGGIWRDECRYNHPIKGLIWLEGQSSPIREPNGDITWHGYIQDITERKQAEQKLRVSEARYRAFFKSGLIGVISWNIDGGITDANDTFLEMLGYTRERSRSRPHKLAAQHTAGVPGGRSDSGRKYKGKRKCSPLRKGISSQGRESCAGSHRRSNPRFIAPRWCRACA